MSLNYLLKRLLKGSPTAVEVGSLAHHPAWYAIRVCAGKMHPVILTRILTHVKNNLVSRKGVRSQNALFLI
jgi:hypothetical protein